MKSEPPSGRDYTSVDYDWAVSCKGSCTSQECSDVVNVASNGFDCPCEDCYMEFIRIEDQSVHEGDEDIINDILSDYGTQSNHLSDFIEQEYNENSFDVTGVKLSIHEANVFYFYECMLSDNTLVTVAFTAESWGGTVTKVDCSGGCSDPAKTCVENWNATNHQISCSCEGECSMTIETVEEPGATGQ